MRPRHAARELAMKILYQWDVRGAKPEWEALPDLLAEAKDSKVRAFAEEIVKGCIGERGEIDGRLKAVAQHWDLDRMAVLDRNILRLGAWELIRHPETPSKVVINEAIELAKRFSTDKSGAFVNGILDRLKPAAAALPAEAASGGAEEE